MTNASQIAVTDPSLRQLDGVTGIYGASSDDVLGVWRNQIRQPNDRTQPPDEQRKHRNQDECADQTPIFRSVDT